MVHKDVEAANYTRFFPKLPQEISRLQSLPTAKVLSALEVPAAIRHSALNRYGGRSSVTLPRGGKAKAMQGWAHPALWQGCVDLDLRRD
jgi:hypothetical protein